MKALYNLVLILLFAAPINLLAANKTTSGNGTLWSDANSWSPAGVPANNDNVTITVANFNIDSDVSIRNLTVQANIIQNGNLTVTGSFAMNGATVNTQTYNFTVSSWLNNLNGEFVSSGGALNFGGGTSNNSLSFDLVNSTLYFSQYFTFNAGNIATNSSTVTFKQGGKSNGEFDINLSNSSTLKCEQYFEFGTNSDVTADNSTVDFDKGAKFVNGNITLTNGSDFTSDQFLEMTAGGISADNSTIDLKQGATLTNGNIELANGSDIVSEKSLSLSLGDLIVSGSTANFKEYVSVGGSVTANSNATIDFRKYFTANPTDISADNSTLNFHDGVTLGSTSNLTLSNSSTISIAKDLNMSGSANIQFTGDNGTDAGSLTIGSDINMSGTSSINIEDNKDLTGTLNVQKNLNINSTVGIDLYNNTGSNTGKVHLNLTGTNQAFNNNSSEIDLYSLDINGGLNIWGSSGVNAYNRVEVLGGTLNTNDKLNLNSDNVTQGYIVSDSNTYTGTLKFTKKYYGTTGWRQISSPISGLTVADLNASMVTSGFPGSDYPNTGYNIYYYDETANGGLDIGFVPITSLNYVFENTKGYYIYMHPDNGTWPLEVQFDGTFNAGDVTYPITYTDQPAFDDNIDGWNFVANPYPSPIDWDAADWTKTNISNAIYIWDKDLNGGTGGFRTYINGVGAQGGQGIIALGQGFWVKATAANPVLTITENCKANLDNGFVRPGELPVVLSIQLHDHNTGFKDETILKIDAQASLEYNNQEDAVKFLNSAAAPNIYFKNQDLKIAINSVNFFGENNIEMAYIVPSFGTYTLQFNRSNFEDVNCIFLEDTETQTFINLKTDSTYTFSHSSNSTPENRFIIHITNGVDHKTVNETCAGNSDGKIEVMGFGTGPWTYTWKDNTGSVLSEDVNNSYESELKDLKPGEYTVEITDLASQCASYSQVIEIEEGLNITAEFEFEALQSVNGSTQIQFTNISENHAGSSWNFGNGFMSTEENPTANYISEGEYTVSLTTTNGSCFSTTSKNIIISSGTTSVKEQVYSSLKIYNLAESWMFELENDAITSVTLTNTSGQVVVNKNGVNANQIELSKYNLPQGIYIVRIETNALKTITQKLVLN